MGTGRPESLGHLETREWQRVQEMAERLEEAWGRGDTIDLQRFLPPEGDPLRQAALFELVKTDLEIRWRRQRPKDLEAYLEQLPELGTAATLPAAVIYEEYRIRHLYGDRPALGSYQARFPSQFAAFSKLLEQQPVPTPFQSTLQPVPGTRVSSSGTASSDRDVLPIVGGYKKIKRLGSGSFGEVWRAEAPGNVETAVKIIFRPLNHQEAKRELQSLELIKRLRHPFLIQTQAYWALEDRLIIAMELADRSLRDRLMECRKEGLTGIPPEELLVYMRESAEALDYLHNEQVHHRDIKPDNILLLKGHAKVADFGLARLLENRQSAEATTVGTPAYMAPEVWRGSVSEHSDQYSLAASYVQLRLDRGLFKSTNMVEVMLDHVQHTPDLSDLPEAEQKVLHRALSKNPAERYPSCTAFYQALQQALFPEIIPEPPARRPWIAAGLVAALCLALGLLLWAWFRRPSPPLIEPAEFAVRAGTSSTVVLLTHPQDREGPVQLQFAGLPPNVEMHALSTAPEGVRIQVDAGPVAPSGSFTFTLHAETDRRRLDQELRLQVEPPAIAAAPPAAGATMESLCERVDGSEPVTIGDKTYHRFVVFHLSGGLDVRLVLVPKAREGDPTTFYIMENKVWNGLFSRFAKANPDAVRDNGWQRGAWVGEGAKGRDLKNSDDWLPVFRILPGEAHAFAQWFAGSSGRLPSVTQWDKAAGRFEANPGEGPFGTRQENLGVGRLAEGPLPVNVVTSDVSAFGCRQMSGNGFEWTRTSALDAREVPNIPADGLVRYRGQSYRKPKPLLWKDLNDKDANQAWPSQSPTKTGPEFSFRIVIELGPRDAPAAAPE